MRLRKLYTALSLAALLAAPSLCLADTDVNAQETADKKVVLTLDSNSALVNDVPCQLEIPPVVVEGTTFLPVRFVTEEVLGAAVVWNTDAKTVEITKGEVQIILSLETGQAMVNGEEVEIGNPPMVKNGRTLVPLRFLAENFNMQIEFDPLERSITIINIAEDTPEPVNLPPVITSLGLQRDEIKIGEVPNYNFTYDNEVGEDIIAEEWSCQFTGDTQIITGKPRAFFRPGEYTLSLRIKDASGKWSETSTTRFTVSDEKLISEMDFKFSKPIYGELYENMEEVNFNHYPANEQVTFERTGPTLHISNSPEVAAQPGILYQSEASGDFRLFYHHLNGSAERMYLYVIAENNGAEPVALTTLKSGVGGPTSDYMNLGQTVAMRYLPSKQSGTITIMPGKKVILNPGLRHLNKGEAVTGMQDFLANGTITISVVMGPEKAPEPETPLDPGQNPAETPMQDDSPIPPNSAQTNNDDLNSNNTGETFQAEDLTNISSLLADKDFDPARVFIEINVDNDNKSDDNKSDSNVDSGEMNVNSDEINEPTKVSKPAPAKTAEEILKEKIEYLLSLPVLPRNSQQIRGVFSNGDCLIDIKANDGQLAKITLGKEDPGFDSWMEGTDPLTGDNIKNIGNYGVVYRIKLTAPVKTGLLLNPRGSIFKGAFLGSDNQVYKAPHINFFSGLQKAAVLGVLEASQTANFIYTPPSGSDTPLVIALIPEEFWETDGK
ncbi:stalk domain-containing protein [Desulfoscipio sp. XC116]|uniref:copper amine oxidase N-terminal domain-containing protein n=1 Tax=Desulfoscipio sp. XC116 TaxID=3144975 RepID=UPI00325A69F2